MTDIHCHLLYGVDDGPDSLKESCRMLHKAAGQGIDKIILTPHYRHGMFSFPAKEIAEHFKKLRPYAAREGVDIFLGCEYHMDSMCIENMRRRRTLTLAGSSYILTEYSYVSEYSFIIRMTEEVLQNGYRPVIAHAERYPAIMCDLGRVSELRRMGAMIQVNADSVLGYEGKNQKAFCKKMLRKDLVDIVASDAHGIKYRKCNLDECYDYIMKKYGGDTAIRLTSLNPDRILTDIL